MLLRIVKTLAYIFVFSTISFTIVYLLNKNNLDLALKQMLEVTPANYNDELKADVAFGSTISITGTPNLFKQVSQESKESTNNAVEYYYVALQEYGNNFVIRIKPGKLLSESQTFQGKVIHLSDTEFGTRIKNSLNDPIDFSDKENLNAANELDQDTKNQIAESSKAEFANDSFLVLDGEVLNSRQVMLGVALWTTVLALFLITIFRKKVFQMR